MIKAKDAIAAARALLGTPYHVLDCINMIKKVIRTAPGGVTDYTTAGTNSLWASYEMSAKYRDLTWRQEGLSGAEAGMIAFKADGDDYHHAGIVTERGTVVHSSSTQGGRGVVETPLTRAEGWTHLAIHRYIETEATQTGEEDRSEVMDEYTGVVILSNPNSVLHVRNAPSTDARRIGKLSNGAKVHVYAELYGEWLYVDYGEGVNGYVAKAYVYRQDGKPAPETEENVIVVSSDVTIVDGEGNTFKPKGGWRVVIGSDD